jgi:hypothetical protein
LEVIDGEGSSTVWDDEFISAAAAKAEFMRSVAEEGLVAVISGEPAAKN